MFSDIILALFSSIWILILLNSIFDLISFVTMGLKSQSCLTDPPSSTGARAGDRECGDAVSRPAQGQPHPAEGRRGAALRAAPPSLRRDHPTAEAVHQR